MSLLWRNTHCRGRREIEEYSSFEVTDSDNNSIEESVEFSDPLSEQILQNLLEVASETELQNSRFMLEVTSSQREKISLQNAEN